MGQAFIYMHLKGSEGCVPCNSQMGNKKSMNRCINQNQSKRALAIMNFHFKLITEDTDDDKSIQSIT